MVPKNLPTSATLRSVTFANDGNTGWAVGGAGSSIILKTTDGGDDWVQNTFRAPATLRSVTFANDGNTGWTVGGSENIRDGNTGWTVGGSENIRDGNTVILTTTNGGDSWVRNTFRAPATLRSVTFANDGNTGWAVGDAGAILLTERRGESWRLLNADNDYRTYRAPWTWTVFVLATLLVYPAFRPLPRTKEIPGVAEELVSDRPITANDPDPLQRGTIADRLSHFLRNENTEPPLTIAITGGWGEGKSSLMNLTQARLRTADGKTVWFDAWHHQKERHLFAALLQAIRDQAIPVVLSRPGFPLSLRGLLFRWHLLRSRFYRYWWWGAAAMFGMAVWVGLWTGGALNYGKALTTAPTTGYNILYLLGHLIPLLPIVALYFGVTPILSRWRADPARLVAIASRGAVRARDLSNQLGFRFQFGQAFKELTDALKPERLVIFIDDLDRCRPEQIVETLEAVNFLVDAAPCYVVMGIAPTQVRDAIGLAFKEMAEEMPDTPEVARLEGAEAKSREKRRTYARSYLDKLINLEVGLPTLTDDAAKQLVENSDKERPRNATQPRPQRGEKERSDTIGVWFRGIACLFALSVGVYIASQNLGVWPPGSSTPAPSPRDVVPTPTPLPQPNVEPSPRDAPAPPGTNPIFRPGATTEVSWWISLILGGLLVLLAIGVTVAHLLRQWEDRIQDSPRFVRALAIWHPVIRTRTNTPRRVKRFINRVRYLAMAPSHDADQQQPSESLIVAFAALQYLVQDYGVAESRPLPLETLLTTSPDHASRIDNVINGWLETIPEDTLSDRLKFELQGILGDAIASHRDQFKDESVTQETIAWFRQMTSRIVVR